MKNGTNSGLLVRDLLTGDSPHDDVADGFVAAECTRCKAAADENARFHQIGYLCAVCYSAVAG